VARYRFALRPRWILSHLLIAALVIVMVDLGLWQLRRLHGRRDANAAIERAEHQPAVPVDTLVRPGDAVDAGGGVAYRRVTATGTYDTANEIIIRARSFDEQPGVWVATPLRLDSGGAVIVVRGFLPTQGTPDAVPADAEPPQGAVTATGLLQPSQVRGSFGPTDPAAGRLTNMARVDLARMQQQVPYPIVPAWLQLDTQAPAQTGPFPRTVPSPALDDGPHLAYAVQWFIFSTIAVVGYPLILRRKARDGDIDEETPDTDGERERDASGLASHV
jgi:surfeit locus 1 family protein